MAPRPMPRRLAVRRVLVPVVLVVGVALLVAGCRRDRTEPAPRGATPPASSPSAGAAADAERPPTGFAARSVSFVSDRRGWALGTVPCPPPGAGRCALVARTDDGGATWRAVGAPGVPAAATADALAVHRIRFAGPEHGWVFGTGLWATRDGGVTWAAVRLPGVAADATVASLAALDGRAHAVVIDGPSVSVLTAAAGSDGWERAPLTLDVGAGPVPGAQVVLADGAGWVLQENRVVVGGARLDGSRWAAWDPPCAEAGGPGVLAARSADEVVAVCNEGVWSGPEPAVRAYRSTDGGATFAPFGDPLPMGFAREAAAPGEGPVVVAAETEDGAARIHVASGGGGWATVHRGAPGGQLADLQFPEGRHGFVLERTADGLSATVLTSDDGGRTWRPAAADR